MTALVAPVSRRPGADAANTIIPASDVTGLAVLSAGDADEQHGLGNATAGQAFEIRYGSESEPDTSPNPPLKSTRTMALSAGLTGNVAEYQGAVVGVCVGVAPGVIQATGLAGVGIQRAVGAVEDPEGSYVDRRCDALGVFGYGVVDAEGSVNTAEGMYAAARRLWPTAYANGQETQIQNFVAENSTARTISSIVGAAGTVTVSVTAKHKFNIGRSVTIAGTSAFNGTYTIVAMPSMYSFTYASGVTGTEATGTATSTTGTAYNPSGHSKTKGMSVSASGTDHSAVAFLLAHRFAKVKVGWGVPSFAAYTDGGGPVSDATWRDDGQADKSLYITKPHSEGAIVVDDQAGAIVVGIDKPTNDQIGSLLIVRDSVGSNAYATGWVGSQTAPAKAHALRLRNSTGVCDWFVASAAGDYGVGTVEGDTGVRLLGPGTAYHLIGHNGGGSGRIRVLSVGYDATLSFFGGARVGKQGSTTDLKDAFVNYGLYTDGGATPLNLDGGVITARLPLTVKSGAYTLTANDEICLVTATAAITLPTAASITGKVYTVKNTGSGTVTVDTTSSETIDGADDVELSSLDAVTVASDGTNWVVVNATPALEPV